MLDFLTAIVNWIDATAFAEEVRISAWLFPALETAHVIAIVLVVGSIVRLDLRLMGLVSTHRPVAEVSDEMLPWTWISFAAATLFGVLLWTSKPMVYFGSAFFDVKLLLMALAGINMLYFHFVTFRSLPRWNRVSIPPLNVRMAGALSMAFWVSVVVCGRLIGFV
jgi:hypothetical protein